MAVERSGAFELYVHHKDRPVWVRSDLKGKHREHCLCYSCKWLNLESHEKNCPKSNLLYALAVELNMVIPIWECPTFQERKGE